MTYPQTCESRRVRATYRFREGDGQESETYLQTRGCLVGAVLWGVADARVPSDCDMHLDGLEFADRVHWMTEVLLMCVGVDLEAEAVLDMADAAGLVDDEAGFHLTLRDLERFGIAVYL